MAFTLLKPTGIDLSQTFAFTGTVTGAGGGKLLQLVNGKNVGGNQSTTSTSYVATGFTLTMTPTAASSKIRIEYTFPANTSNANTSCKLRVYRSINGASFAHFDDDFTFNAVYFHASANSVSGLPSFQVVDTPSYSVGQTVAYKIYFASSDGGQVHIHNETGNKSNLTLMEIGAWLVILINL